MNTYLCTQAPYSGFGYLKQSVCMNDLRQSRFRGQEMQVPDVGAGFNTRTSYTGREEAGKRQALSQEKRRLIREIKETPKQNRNPHAAFSGDKANGILQTAASTEEDDDKKIEKPVNYNYKEVASKIQRAKTSVSAEQAVLSAKRKVLEMKRKISVGDGDSDELQAALTHAKRMEMVARKKKHHLELEELVVVTQKRDEKLDKSKEAADDLKNAMLSAEEEKIAEKEDAIFEERDEMLEEAKEQLEENLEEASGEMLEELNKMISEFGEEELKALEEAMEMLESMEVIDPHMSKEDLEELKRKHRADENKAIMKADMDYIKDTVKHRIEKASTGMTQASGTSGVSGSGSIALSGVSFTAAGSFDAGIMSGMSFDGGSIDVQV